MSRRQSLQARVDDYLAERRRQGFHLRSRYAFLSGFASFVAARRHHGPLTAELMTEWVRAGKNGNGDALADLGTARPLIGSRSSKGSKGCRESQARFGYVFTLLKRSMSVIGCVGEG